VTRPNPDDAHNRTMSEQRQRAEVRIVREDDSSLAMGLLEELLIAPPVSPRLSHIQDVESSASQVRYHVEVNVFVREPSRVR
jgi:hypothetical protein